MTKHLAPGVCERCGVDEHVNDGLCRRCRKMLLGEGAPLERAHEDPVHEASAEPLHSPPWRRRGA